MKKQLIFLFIFLVLTLNAQKLDNIEVGETLTYRIHYGFLNAGYATLKTTKLSYAGQPHLHVVGTGKSTGAVNAFFKVKDQYESYINLKTGLPSYYVRNIHEGSYRQHLEAKFNHDTNSLILMDKKNKDRKNKFINFPKDMQDMLSAFYYLRATKPELLKKGYKKNMNVWIDDEYFPFQIKVVGTQTIRTKFGKINAIKIIPLVKSGRVFKENEGVTLWVSNDENLIPLSMKAKLVVGSLKADLYNYQNVKYKLNFE